MKMCVLIGRLVITVPEHVYVPEMPLMYVMLLTETVFVNQDGPEPLVMKFVNVEPLEVTALGGVKTVIRVISRQESVPQ